MAIISVVIPGDLCNGSEDINCTTSSVTSNIEESSELTQVSSAEEYIDEESDLLKHFQKK